METHTTRNGSLYVPTLELDFFALIKSAACSATPYPIEANYEGGEPKLSRMTQGTYVGSKLKRKD